MSVAEVSNHGQFARGGTADPRSVVEPAQCPLLAGKRLMQFPTLEANHRRPTEGQKPPGSSCCGRAEIRCTDLGRAPALLRHTALKLHGEYTEMRVSDADRRSRASFLGLVIRRRRRQPGYDSSRLRGPVLRRGTRDARGFDQPVNPRYQRRNSGS